MRLAFLSPLVLMPILVGQNCVYSLTNDPLGSSSSNGYPLSPVGTQHTARISQIKLSRHRFQNAPMSISGLAISMDTDHALMFGSLRVRMGLAADPIGLAFANNFATQPQTVLDTHDYFWPHRHGQWTELGLQVPFLYVPAAGDLLIEIVAEGITSTSAVNTSAYSFQTQTSHAVTNTYFSGTPPTYGGWTQLRPMLRLSSDLASQTWSGTSCSGSSGTRPGLGFSGSATIGATTNIWLSNALPSQFGLLAFGVEPSSAYPLDLTAFGMPGCWQHFDPEVTVGVMTDGLGMAGFPMSIPPDPALSGIIMFSQVPRP